MPGPRLATAQREALARLLEAPKLEVLPLASLMPQLEAVQPGATLTVTCSPAKGIDASVTLAERLRSAGFEVVIHLAARMVRDQGHLRGLVAALGSAGVDRAFVIGGDASQVGAYADSVSLLRELVEVGHPFREIGIAGYPQGHPEIPDDRLLADLAAKAHYADYITTQICFDAPALRRWLGARSSEGLALPVYVGVPGAVDVARLLRVSARIGVADARRFVARHAGLIGRFLRPGGYQPGPLLTELAATFADPAAGVAGLHIYTFNQLARTEAWRRGYLARLRA